MAARARGSRLPPWARWAIRIVLAVLVLWIVASVVVLWQARERTNDGLDALERARAELDGGGLLRGEATDDLREAREHFEAANDLADGALLAPWRVVPLISGNVDSVASLTDAAARVSDVGARTAEASRNVLEARPGAGAERLELLEELEAVTARAEQDLAGIDLGPDFFLVEPLGDARERFDERLTQLREAVTGAREASQGAETLLEGPRKYLVLAANNAEMRAGSGMFLSAGVATFEDGELTVGDMRSTTELPVPAGAVSLPPELEDLWGFVPVTQDWRYLATTPRFDATAPIAADMWEAATGERVDGVLVVDPVALQALLAAQGPISGPSGQLSADDVVQYLLLGQYEGLDAPGANDQRRDELSSVARSAIDTLSTRPWNSGGLVTELGDVGRGRHVLAWSRDEAEQRAWRGAGIAGELEADSLAVNLLNTGGNKLDQFVVVDADLRVRDRDDGDRQATLVIELANDAPEGLPPYVAGPHGLTDLAEGEYQGILTVNVPASGSYARIDGAGPVLVAGVDGPTKVTGVSVRLPRGDRLRVEASFRLPGELATLLIESSGRVPPIHWDALGERFDDTRPHLVEL